MRKTIFEYSKKILIIPKNRYGANKYGKLLEAGQLGPIFLYLYKKYKIIDFFVINEENKKLPDFYFGYDIEEIPRGDYELTESCKFGKENINKEEFYNLFGICINKKSKKLYSYTGIKGLIIHSHYTGFKKMLKNEIVNYLHDNKEDINFDVIIFSCLIDSENKSLISIYNKKHNIGYIIIVKADKKNIQILEDTKFDFNTKKIEYRIAQ